MPSPHRSDPSSCLRSRSAAMPIFTYFAVAGSVLIALLFVADATLEKGTPAVVTSQNGLPKHPVVTSARASPDRRTGRRSATPKSTGRSVSQKGAG